jgi:heat shock protein HtpX
VTLTPDAVQTRRLVDEQIARNRTFTGLIATAAVLNAVIAAWVVGSIAGGVAALVCLLLIAATIGAVWVFAEQLIPRRLGARPLSDDEFPAAHAVVARLAGKLEIPVPMLYIVDDDALNAGAFGTGDRAFVIYTAGLLAELDERELTAVTAHELAHIVNRDTRVSGVSRNLLGWAIVVCAAVAVLAALIVELGSAVAEGDDSGFGWVFLIGCAVAAAMVFVLGMLWFALAQDARLALNRQREWMADATAARITGDSKGLCVALKKIERKPELEAGGALLKS